MHWKEKRPKVEAAPPEWAPRSATHEQVTLEIQRPYLQNKRLDFCVQLPKFKYKPGHLSEQWDLRWETEFFALLISLICKMITRAKRFHCWAAAQTQCWQTHLAHGGNSKRKRKMKMVAVTNNFHLKKKKKITDFLGQKWPFSKNHSGAQPGLVWDTNKKISFQSIFHNNWFEYIRIFSRYKSSGNVNVLLGK